MVWEGSKVGYEVQVLQPRQRQQMLWRLLQAIAHQHQVVQLLQPSKMLPAGCPLNAAQLQVSQC